MSLAELKQGAETLSVAERTELRAHLRLLDLKGDKVRQADLSDRVRAGRYIDQDEVRRLIASQSGPRP
jgi:hypothetical protein